MFGDPFVYSYSPQLTAMATENKPARITIIDALRGFALAGIVLVHMTENYIGGPTTEDFITTTHSGILDYIVDGFVLLFLRGKFFALFSFLFGLSFFIQLDRSETNSADFKKRFLWRLVILFIIGYAHHLFYRGDILTIYAILGVLLVPFHKASNKVVLATAAVLLIGLFRFLIFGLNPEIHWLMDGDYSPGGADTRAYYELLQSAGILEVFKSNATEGMLMKMDFQLGVISRAYLTLGFFLLGLYIGRERWFQRFRDPALPLGNLMWTGGIMFVVGIALAGFGFFKSGPEAQLESWYAMVGLTGMDINNIGMTIIIFVLFIWGYRKKFWEKILAGFAPYGRMALSNYVLQSVIGTFVFYGWGLGYIGELTNRWTFLLGILLIALQMVFSKWWLNRFHYGPLEWAWRSITHFKRYPMTKSNPQ